MGGERDTHHSSSVPPTTPEAIERAPQKIKIFEVIQKSPGPGSKASFPNAPGTRSPSSFSTWISSTEGLERGGSRTEGLERASEAIFSVADRRQSLQRLDGGLISVTLPTARSNSCARPGTATAIDGAPLRIFARRLACGAVPDCHPIPSFFFPPFLSTRPPSPAGLLFVFLFVSPAGRLFSRGQLGGAVERGAFGGET
jgi:hypothetical protein